MRVHGKWIGQTGKTQAGEAIFSCLRGMLWERGERMITIRDRIFRPPPESGSELLEIAVGCSYGACTFCQYSAGDIPLQVSPVDVICANLEELSRTGSGKRRMFLTGGNVFAFKTEYLLTLFDLIKTYLPQITQLAMYARADDVERKSDEQLTALREAGLHTLYVGIESGNEQVLRMCRKNETRQQMLQNLWRLDSFGIQYGLSSILGLGGRKLWQQHALDTASFYSAVTPASIRVMTLNPIAGTPLARDIAAGRFQMPEPEDILREELLLLENIHYTGGSCRFVGNHHSNAIPLTGLLPADREALLESLRQALKHKTAGSQDVIRMSDW